MATATRFSLFALLFTFGIAACIYVASSALQVQSLDSDLLFAGNGLLAQFHALPPAVQQQLDQVTKPLTDAMSDDDDKSGAVAKTGIPGAGSIVTFVEGMGASPDSLAPTDDNDALYVRLVDARGATAALCHPLKARADIVRSLTSVNPSHYRKVTFEFVGGGSMPVLRVETLQINGYQMQLARSFKAQNQWLAAFALDLAVIAFLLSAATGAGGYFVARGEMIARERETALARTTRLPIERQVAYVDETPVARRTLTEQPAAGEATETEAEKPTETPRTVRRNVADDEPVEEQQQLGRGE